MELTAEHHDWVHEVLGLDMQGGAPGDAAAPGGGSARERGKKDSGPTSEQTAMADAMWKQAIEEKNWAQAAFSGNVFSARDLADRLKPLGEADQISLFDAAAAMDLGDCRLIEATRDVALAAARKTGDWGKIAKCLNGFGPRGIKGALTHLSGDEVEKIHKAAAADSDMGPNSLAAMATETLVHPVLGTMQQGQASAKEAKLSEDDKKKYHALLDAAKSPKEKQFLTKGLAANHSVAELEAFAHKIAGKDDKWMQDHLSLTGQSDGHGIKQQWHDSCGPTTYEAVQGELDPLYALKMHEDNARLDQADDSKPDKPNPLMAADQKAVLEAGGGKAVRRKTPSDNDPAKQGKGRWIAPALNQVSGTTGLTYATKGIDPTNAATSTNAAITKISAALAKGAPVPIVIGQSVSDTHHYVLVTATDPGPPRYFTIHDPWSGKTMLRSEDQLTTGKLDIAGCNVLAAYEEPTEVARR